MTERALDILRRGHAAFNTLDPDALTAVTHPDVEWGTSGAFPDMDRIFHGHAGVLLWAEQVRETWEWFEVVLDEVLLDDEDRVIVAERVRGRGRGSGVDVDMVLYSDYRVRDGLLWDRTSHRHRPDTLSDDR